MALCKPGRVGASCLVNGCFNFYRGCRASYVSRLLVLSTVGVCVLVA